MLDGDEHFQQLMNEVIKGSEEAAQKLFTHYEPYLIEAIRKRLSRKIRSKFDSLDFAQDVWASFFADLAEKPSFNTPDDLVAFLTRVAHNKVLDALRSRFQVQKRDAEREQSLDDSEHIDKEDLLGPQQTPSEILMGKEEWTAFLNEHPPVYRRIFVLFRQGYNTGEISQQLNINMRTVQRVVGKLALRSLALDRQAGAEDQG